MEWTLQESRKEANATMHRIKSAVKNHILRTANLRWSKKIRDPRRRRGRRWNFFALMNALWAGMLSAMRNLRGVEQLTERMGRRVPDTTLWELLSRLSPGSFRNLLVDEVRKAYRAKELEPSLPFSVVAVDGKAIWTGKYKANRYCQRQSQDDTYDCYTMRVVRASFVGGPCKIVIDQMPVKRKKAEMSSFPVFLKRLVKAYGRSGLLDVLTLDAGYISKDNARRIDEAQLGYVMALKNPQKELVEEAERLLRFRRKPDAVTPWEHYRGKRMRRLLFRTTEMAGYNGWTHLREVWRIRQETEKDGECEVENRYFVTNLVPGRAQGSIPLEVVRAHWGIENNAFWTLDTAWEEDASPWSAKSAEVVSLMRVMAFNVVMRLRTRRLRSRANRMRSWRNLIALISDVLLECRITAKSLFAKVEYQGPLLEI